MSAWEHHGRIVVRGLLLAHGAYENGVINHALGERRLKGKLMRRGPLRVLALDLVEELHKLRQGNGARRGGHVQRRLGRESQQRAELSRFSSLKRLMSASHRQQHVSHPCP